MSMPILLLCGKAGVGKDTVAALLKEYLFDVTRIAQADPIKRFAYHAFGFPAENLWGPSELREASHIITKLLPANVAFTSGLPEVDWEMEVGSLHAQRAIIQAYEDWYSKFRTGMKVTARVVLQEFGTLVREKLSADFWVKIACQTASHLLAGGWEYDRTTGLRSKDGAVSGLVVITDGRYPNEVLGVKRQGGKVVRIDRTRKAVAPKQQHHSETSLDKVPYLWFDAVIENYGDLTQLRRLVMEFSNSLSPAKYDRSILY